MFLHPEIIDSELNKLEPYHPIAYGKILDLIKKGQDFHPSLHTFLTDSSILLGKDMFEFTSNGYFARYVNDEKQIYIFKV